MDYKITELAYLRNQLASERFLETDKDLLSKVKFEISNGGSCFRELGLNAICNCEEDIRNGNLKSATQEIQLIHNFPFKGAGQWNEDYFYRVEILSYIDQINDSKRVKKLICLLADLSCAK